LVRCDGQFLLCGNVIHRVLLIYYYIVVYSLCPLALVGGTRYANNDRPLVIKEYGTNLKELRAIWRVCITNVETSRLIKWACRGQGGGAFTPHSRRRQIFYTSRHRTRVGPGPNVVHVPNNVWTSRDRVGVGFPIFKRPGAMLAAGRSPGASRSDTAPSHATPRSLAAVVEERTEEAETPAETAAGSQQRDIMFSGPGHVVKRPTYHLGVSQLCCGTGRC
jgi:hypothetical protein